MPTIVIYKKDELTHHGILGQKWGKRNGPPYPLGASDHSASEKKAGWKKSLGGGRNESEYGKKAQKKTLRDRYEKALRDKAEDRQKRYENSKNAFSKSYNKKKAEQAKSEYDRYVTKKEWLAEHPKEERKADKAHEKQAKKEAKELSKQQKKEEKRQLEEFKKERDEAYAREYEEARKKNGVDEIDRQLNSQRLDPWMYETIEQRDKIMEERSRLVDKSEALNAAAYKSAHEKVDKMLAEKYGEIKISDFSEKEKKQQAAWVVGLLATYGALAASNVIER